MQTAQVMVDKLKLAKAQLKKRKAKLNAYVQNNLKKDVLVRTHRFATRSSKWLDNLSESLSLKLALETNDVSLLWDHQLTTEEWDAIAKSQGWGYHTGRAPTSSNSRFQPKPPVYPPGYTPPEGFVGTVENIRERTQQDALTRGYGPRSKPEVKPKHQIPITGPIYPPEIISGPDITMAEWSARTGVFPEDDFPSLSDEPEINTFGPGTPDVYAHNQAAKDQFGDVLTEGDVQQTQDAAKLNKILTEENKGLEAKPVGGKNELDIPKVGTGKTYD